MDITEPPRVAIMRKLQEKVIGNVVSLDRHAARPGVEHPLQAAARHEAPGRRIGQDKGRVRGRGSGGREGRRLAGRRRPAVQDDPLRTDREFERQSSRVGGPRKGGRRRTPGVDHQDSRSGFEPLVSRIGRIGQREPACIVIGQNGRERVGPRHPHAVESGQRPIAKPERSHHRHHAIDGVEQGRRYRHASRGIGLAKRQKIHQQVQDKARVPADMAAVGQDLTSEFVREQPRRPTQQPGQAFGAERHFGKRDDRDQSDASIEFAMQAGLEIVRLPSETAHEPAIESGIRAIEDQRRLAEPGENPASDDFGTPGRRGVRPARNRNPVVHQCTPVDPGERGIGGAQVSEPAEAGQCRGPSFAGRRDLERRRPAGVHRLAVEDEIAGVDICRYRRVGGSDVLGRDHEP